MPALVGSPASGGGLTAPRPSENGASTGSSNASSVTVGNATITAGPGDPRGQQASQQLQDLSSQLQLENRIKEGAENLLQMPLTGSLRLQVESELEMALHKIDTITKKIETQSVRGARKKTNDSGPIRKKFNGQPLQPTMKGREENEERDDFRTALHQATSLVKALSNISRHSSQSPTNSPSSSTFPATSSDADLNHPRIESMNQLITVLQRNLRVRYEVKVGDAVQAILPCLSDRASKQCRATAYRLIRHMLVDSHSVKAIREQPLDWYIVKSLARDNKHAVEKEQVIKLIRAIVEIGSERRGRSTGVGSGSVPLSEPVMRALVAVAEHQEEPFRPICIQTLTEILLIDVALMAKTGGFRVLLHALAEGPLEMAPILASAFLYIADSPKTRAYLRPGTDLEMALSGVTDAYGKGSEHADRMKGVSKIIVSMMRTWSGLLYFCIHNKLAIRTLVDGLRIPSLETREVILDMFFDLLNIKPPEWHQAFIDGRRLTVYRRTRPEPGKPPEAHPRPQEALKLTDQYIALLILVLSRAGLVDALTSMLGETAAGSNLSRKATLLMAEILQTANRVLPLSLATDIQALPRVFNLASDYILGENRIIGTSALSAIDSYNRHRARLQPTVVKDHSRPRANSVEDAVRRGQRQVEQAKIKLGMQMDDKTFQNSLLETQVMLTKDQTKWNFDVLQDLIEGPLLNPKRLEEAIKVSRYIRKLMSFYHPFAHRFSDLASSKSNVRWVRLGCTLLNVLMSSPDGLRFLSEDDFLREIVKSFAQLDPFNGSPNSDPIFSKKRMQETLTYGYFEMLGTMSKRKEGIELLEKFKIFTAFYHLSELRSREDLIKCIIDNLDYSIDGHSRIVLSKALTSSYKHIRLYSTNHLGELIRNSSVANSWTLRLLLTQLYDPSHEVQELAVRYLEEACEATDVLQTVVEMHPTLDHLGEVGHALMLKFMSTPTGFRYLYAADYIDREMDMWFHERNLHYVVHIEVFLAKAFNFTPSDDDEDVMAFDGIVPPHFYGVMAKTELGCQVLQEKRHFTEFASFIRQHGLESEDQDLILKLKSVLWAVGNIGAAEGGLPFLEEEDVIPSILTIAEQSLVFSVRGTCFFVLGLISSTPQGAEILDDHGWEATLSPLGLPTGLCVPLDVETFISIPPWEPIADGDNGENRLEYPTSDEEVEVMTAIYNLANTVIANTASRSLAKMKSRSEYKHVFSSTTMLYRALHTISTQRYRLPVRRYILDLFNIELDADIVKALSECAQKMTLPTCHDMEKTPAARVVSVFGRPGWARGMSDSDEESDSVGEERPEVEQQPVLKVRPVSRIVGFK